MADWSQTVASYVGAFGGGAIVLRVLTWVQEGRRKRKEGVAAVQIARLTNDSTLVPQLIKWIEEFKLQLEGVSKERYVLQCRVAELEAERAIAQRRIAELENLLGRRRVLVGDETGGPETGV